MTVMLRWYTSMVMTFFLLSRMGFYSKALSAEAVSTVSTRRLAPRACYGSARLSRWLLSMISESLYPL
jgi:hypothetical protein